MKNIDTVLTDQEGVYGMYIQRICEENNTNSSVTHTDVGI